MSDFLSLDVSKEEYRSGRFPQPHQKAGLRSVYVCRYRKGLRKGQTWAAER